MRCILVTEGGLCRCVRKGCDRVFRNRKGGACEDKIAECKADAIDPMKCVYRGDREGSVEIDSCCGETAVFGCVLHGKCTPLSLRTQYVCCEKCQNYLSDA